MKNTNVHLLTTLFAGLASVIATGSVQAALLTKSPDLGPYYLPFSPGAGSYAYANSFVPPQNSTVVSLGSWIEVLTDDPGTTLKFQVMGSIGNSAAAGPDAGNVLATTADLGPFSGSLGLYSAVTPGSATLTAGNTYWFVATLVGATDNGQFGVFQFGGHTRNSGGIVDDGAFWYSNELSGQPFVPINDLTEMAFQVELDKGGSGVLDTDGDGIPDSVDACPNSDLRPTVIIGTCDSQVPNTLFSDGCTLSDLVAKCAEGATSKQFEDCVKNLTKSLKDRGLLTGRQMAAIRKCAREYRGGGSDGDNCDRDSRELNRSGRRS